MDYVFLEGLELPCRVGNSEHERETPQSLQVDMRIGCSLARSAASGRLEDSVDYGIARDLIALVQDREYMLLETVAEQLAGLALSREGVLTVAVTVRKRPPIQSLRFSGVSIERSRPSEPPVGTV